MIDGWNTHTHLSDVVEGEPGEDDVSKELGHAEDAVHHPVGQPFCVVLFGGAFDGLDPEGDERSSRPETLRVRLRGAGTFQVNSNRIGLGQIRLA